MRASLNRERSATGMDNTVTIEEYKCIAIQSFDDILERVGARGTRFQIWCNKLTAKLTSDKHNEFCLGMEELGRILGYNTGRPKHKAATDCFWKGIFGDTKEVLTTEAKIEHVGSTAISPSDVGQVHNQMQRAKIRYEQYGYSIYGVIVTHLTEIEPTAQSSMGNVCIIQKDSIIKLWEIVKQLLTEYRNSWSVDDINVRRNAAAAIMPKMPSGGWLGRALSSDQHILSSELFLAEWQ